MCWSYCELRCFGCLKYAGKCWTYFYLFAPKCWNLGLTAAIIIIIILTILTIITNVTLTAQYNERLTETMFKCCRLFVFHAIAHDNSTLLLTVAVMGAPCSVCTIIYKHMYLHCKNNTANRSLHVCFHLSSLYNPINKSVMINCSCLLSSLFHAREDNQQYMTTLNQWHKRVIILLTVSITSLSHDGLISTRGWINALSFLKYNFMAFSRESLLGNFGITNAY